jgi:hypothetical protein
VRILKGQTMVTAVLDPIRMPTVTLSEEELETYTVMIEQGQLPADWLDRYEEGVKKNVFGHDYKTDRNGNPIEQGLGSANNQTANSIAAYKKYCNPENPKAADPDPNFERNLAQMQKQFAETEERRKKLFAEQQQERKRRTTVR